MDNRPRLIKRHLSANMQGEVGSTYDATQDVAMQGVLVPQPKVCQHCRFVLRNRVAVDYGVNARSADNDERLTNEDAESRLIHPDA